MHGAKLWSLYGGVLLATMNKELCIYTAEITGCVFTNNKNTGIKFNASIIFGLGCNFSIVNSEFHKNEGGHVLVTFKPWSSLPAEINIENSTFTHAVGSSGVSIESLYTELNLKVIMRYLSFSNNQNGALHIINAKFVEVMECVFTKNNHAGMLIDVSAPSFRSHVTTYKLSNCVIQNNMGTGLTVKGNQNNEVILEKSTIEGNWGIDRDCSALHVCNISNFMIRDVDIADNHCTGIKLSASIVTLET